MSKKISSAIWIIFAALILYFYCENIKITTINDEVITGVKAISYFPVVIIYVFIAIIYLVYGLI